MNMRYLPALGILAVLSTATVGAQSPSPVADAAQRGDRQMVSALLKKKADVVVRRAMVRRHCIGQRISKTRK